MRDVLIVPFNEGNSIVIGSDNSGGIGLKPNDEVRVPYEVLGYYSLRVAAMEVIAAGGIPFAVTLHNFCGETAWEAVCQGVNKGLNELKMKNVRITGSSESNFSLYQSALSINVLGEMTANDSADIEYDKDLRIAVIGTPLVGEKVTERKEEVVPLYLFKKITSLKGVVTLPVGSKGILSELNSLFSNRNFHESEVSCEHNLHQSAGPSTCFLAVYHQDLEEEMKKMAGTFFHSVSVKG
ncbi:ATP-binding protein [Bacillus massilinigeriensis]|uniref:ATP-binding protein n=1 Tax=Bacillus mediterraneensis TaxID=1805474 RepID=UPI0008F88E67|nr:ATP-binding protein [Bacillus mediterraneensis]